MNIFRLMAAVLLTAISTAHADSFNCMRQNPFSLKDNPLSRVTIICGYDGALSPFKWKKDEACQKFKSMFDDADKKEKACMEKDREEMARARYSITPAEKLELDQLWLQVNPQTRQ